MPILNQSSINNPSLRRRQTIGVVQGRQYSSRRTTLQQLQAMFWPARHSHTNQEIEHEQIPMVNQKRPSNIKRSSSARENKPIIPNENSNERRRRHRNQRHAETMVIV